MAAGNGVPMAYVGLLRNGTPVIVTLIGNSAGDSQGWTHEDLYCCFWWFLLLMIVVVLTIWVWINPFLMGWTSIYQLFWCSPGLQGFDTLPYYYYDYYVSLPRSSTQNYFVPGKGGGKGKSSAGNGCGACGACGAGKGKSAEAMTAPSCKARDPSWDWSWSWDHVGQCINGLVG